MLKKAAQKISSDWSKLQTHSLGSKGRVKVTCFGGAEQVTGANFLIEFKGENKTIKILIDCGLPQGIDAEHNQWADFKYDPTDIDFLFITHGHMDHIGRIPFLKNKGFNGEIISTKPTKEIAYESLKDALHIMTKELEKGNIEAIPYKERDIESSFANWKAVEYRQKILLGKDLVATLFNSSHVLGSAFIQINFAGEKILFTGDMGKNSLLLPEAEIPDDNDVVFMECVYGSRLHEGIAERKQNLLNAIKRSVEKHGTLVIAAFAIERTQEILKEINDFIENKQIPKIPVYLDAPLAIHITKIFKKYGYLFNLEMQNHIKNHHDDIFKFSGLHFTESHDESMSINDVPSPKIIIAGSGMIAGGRIINHVKKYISNSNNTILLAGYQAVGTYGRLLSDGKKHIIFYGEPYDVKADIVQLSGYSAHRDQEGLLEFVDVVRKNAKSINLILGDKESLLSFKEAAYNKFGISCHICLKNEILEF